ncbi:MAG: hypothetical protein KBA51_02400 [Kiritimatiellae bacterium]|nr:hypothetical protein [Kiritimatiellia bacterium]
MDMAWIGAAALLIRWWIIGVCWRRAGLPRDSRMPSGWEGAGRFMSAVWLGLLLEALGVMALLFLGIYTARAEWLLLPILMMTGLAAGKRPWNTIVPSRSEGMVLGIVLLGWIALARAPDRSEWMVGGWDPGLYPQQGVVLSRTGTWRAPPDRLWSALSDGEIPKFTRLAFGVYTEAYPGIPLHPDRRSLEPFAFPLAPVVMAQFYRAGGLPLLFRVNDLLGWLGALGLATAAAALTRSRYAAWAAGLALMTHAIWTYHMHLPTSEVLQVLMLSAVALGYSLPVRSRSVNVWISAFLLAASLNRISFFPFGAALLLADALRRPAARGRAWWGVALAAGVLLDIYAVPITVARMGRDLNGLWIAGGIALCMTGLVAGALRRRPSFRTLGRRMVERGIPAAVVAMAAGCAAIARWHPRISGELGFAGWTADVFWSYAGGAFIALAILGLLAAPRKPSGSALRLWILFLFVSAAATLLRPTVGGLAPWALRRQVEFMLPLLALGVAQLALWMDTRLSGFWRRCMIPLLLCAGAAGQAPRAWAAWRATEFIGLDRIFRELTPRISPSDIVIADHFRWAAPLRRIYDRDVLNGEVWCVRGEEREDDFEYAVARLERMARERGGRLLFLTSTPRRLEVFPPRLPPLTAEGESLEWTSREVIHHKNARTFKMESKRKEFRLYAMAPSPASPETAPRPAPTPAEGP